MKKGEDSGVKRLVSEAFASEGITEYGFLPITEVRILRPELFLRGEPITPKSVLLFLVPYYTGPAENLSLYAVSRDYHLYMQGLAARLIGALSAAYPDAAFRAFSDHSPIGERYAAARAGLGILGDNGLLINEKYGSLIFVGEIFSDLEAPADTPVYPVGTCEHCGACLRACPTAALSGQGECLSELTQRKGELAEETISLMLAHKTVWGCDLCQIACPHTRRAIASGIVTPIPFFHKERIPHLTSALLDGMDTATFKSRAFAWRGRTTITRNLAAYERKNEKP